MPAITSTSSSGVPTRSRVEEFLAKHDPVRARLIVAADATASREGLWDMSVGLTGEMFQAVAGIGGIDVQLVHYKGFGRCHASQWVSDPKKLAGIMASVRCEAGHTQIGRVLRHILREHAQKKINAAVVISDACEEHESDLYNAARELGGVPVFMFQEGNDDRVAGIYAEIARITSGAVAKFDSGAAARLADLLKAVAAFAAGGIKALEAQKSAAATLLLTQMKK
jgi:hypothetical protein